MSNEIHIDGKRLISSKDAGNSFGLTPDYISRLSREAKVPGQLIGRTWYVDADKLSDYLAQRDAEKKNLSQELRGQRLREYQQYQKPSNGIFSSIARTVLPVAVTPAIHTLNDLFPSEADPVSDKAPVSIATSLPVVTSRISPIMVFPAVIMASLLFSVSAFAMINPTSFKQVANSFSSGAHRALSHLDAAMIIVRGSVLGRSGENLAAANVTLAQAAQAADAATTTVSGSSSADVATGATDQFGSGPLVIGDTLVPRPDFSAGTMEVGVPFSVTKTLSVDGTATFGGALNAARISSASVRAGSLAVAGASELGNIFVSGASIFSGAVSARGGITTSGADVDLQGGKIFASNVVNGIKGGSNVTITGTANNPIISVNVPPAVYGGGGGGGNGTVTSVTGSSGLTGSITTSGSLSIDFSSANTWNALQVFAGGASSTSLTLGTALGITSGGTGTSTAPSYGQLLVGDGDGGYAFSTNFSVGQNGATTTNFAITSATSSLLKVDGNGVVSAAVLGSDFLDPTSLNTSAKLAAYLTDETGTAGSVVFSASPTFSGTANFVSLHATGALIADDVATLNAGFTSGSNSVINGGLLVTGNATSSSIAVTGLSSSLVKVNALGQLVAAVPGVDYSTNGTGVAADSNWLYRFGALTPTTTIGVIVSASSTIGNGTQTGGLTIYGGATTTGNQYVAGSLTLGQALAIGQGGTGATTAAGARTNLGLGTIATQDATSVAITGGTLTGVSATTTNLAITSLANSILKVNGNGSVVAAIAGTDYMATGTLSDYLSLANWYSTTTDQLAEGVNNLYFTTARTRASLSSSAAGLTYSTSTGALSLTSGYTIPLIASTTEWTSAFQSRINSVSGPLSFVNNALSIQQASGSQGGYLSAGDWTTFNNKLSLSSLSANAPLTYDNTTGVFSIVQANGTQGGYLSAGDWTTFNSKQNALAFSYPLINTAGTISSAFATTTDNTFSGTNTFNGNTALAAATSSSFAITNLTNAILKTNANGSVVAATAGTDYVATSTLTNYLSLANWYATTTDALREGTTNQYFTTTRVRASLFAVGPLNFNSTTGTFSISQASSTNDGYLSSTDWTTFNSKLSANSLSGSGVISYNSGTGVITTAGGTFGAGNYTFPGSVAVTGTATTSNLSITGVTGTILKTNALGQIVPAVAGTDYISSGGIASNSTWYIVGGALAPTTTIGTIVSASSTFTSVLNANSLTLGNALTVANGGTGATSLTGLVKGNGTSAFTTATPGTDYQAPITVSYPILFSGNNLTLGFGTTTTNAWSNLQTLTSGFIANASSTINGGLTVAGNATTTGNSIVQGALGVTGLSTLGTGFVSQASSTVVGNLGVTGTANVGALSIGSLNGILKTSSGAVVTATAGTDYAPATSGSSILYGNGSGGFSSVSVSGPLSFSTGTLSITNASADASTKGAATFASADFNDNGSGVISLDYANGQLATASQNGFLSSGNWTNFNNKVSSTSLSATGPLAYNSSTGVFSITQSNGSTNGYLSSTDWTTFNNKQAALTFTYPLINTANTITTAFGTTTANTFSALQTLSAGASTTNISASGTGYFATASTTNLTISGTPSTLLKTDAIGNVVPAVAGTDYATAGSVAGSATWILTNGYLTPTTTLGIMLNASSTIGNGTQAGGLTISGGATTTGKLVVQGTATSTFAAGIQGTFLNLTGTGATSTFAAGLNITSGCFSVNGACITAGGLGGLSGTGVASQVAFYNGPSTLTSNSGFTFDGTLLTVTSLTTPSFTATNATTTNLAITGITNAYLATDATGRVIATSSISGGSLTGIVAIANGGTATGTQVTNGVNYFDGTNITSGTALTFNGTTLAASNISTGGTLGVTGLSTFGGFISNASSTVNGNFTVAGTATTTGNQYIGGALTVNGTASTSGQTILANAYRFYTGNADGNSTFTDFRTNPSTGNGIISAKSNSLFFNYDHGTGGSLFCNGATVCGLTVSQNGNLVAASGQLVGFSATALAGNAALLSPDSALSRLAANKLAVGNGTAGDFSGTLIAANIGIGTTSPFTKLGVAGDAYIGGNLTATGTLAIAGNSSLQQASTTNLSVSGTTYLTGQTSSLLITSATGAVGNATVSGPLSFSSGTLSIQNASADASTKGAATFASADFNDNGSGVISLDYANGQLATASQNGFLSSGNWTNFNNKVSSTSLSATGPLAYNSSTGVFSITQSNGSTNGYLSSTDWTTFNNKQAALTFTYPLINTANTISTAFGTTTNNTYSGTNTFNGNVALTNATTTSLAITGLSNTILAVDASGNVVATTTAGLGVIGISNGGTATSTQVTNGVNYFDGTRITSNAVLSFSGSLFTAPNITTGGTLSATGLSTLTGGYVSQASSTVVGNFTNTGNHVVGGTLNVSGNTLLANATSTNFFSTTASSTNLFSSLGSIGTLNLVNDLSVANGGTGAGSFAYGLVFSNGGTGALTNIATSSLGLLTTNVAEGSNLYYTDTRARAALSVGSPLNYNSSTGAFSLSKASSTADGYLSSSDWSTFNSKPSLTSFSASYPIIYNSGTGAFSSAFSTTTNNTYSGTNTFNGNVALTNATTTSFAITGITNSLLATDASGNVVATSSLSTGSLTGILGIANGGTATGTQVTNGVNYFDGTRITSGSVLSFNGSLFKTPSLFATGSSTIGDGTQAGGLTIAGGATTTGTSFLSGNVGIGKQPTANALDVSGSIVASAQVAASSFKPTGSSVPSVGLYLPVANTLGFAVNTTAVAVLNATGFGIGTTSPFAKLGVAGDAYIGGNLTATGTVTTALGAGLVKSSAGGVLSIAASGTDYAPATSGTTILLGNGSGGFSAYGGSSCTNQFVRSINGAGVATCASVGLTTDVTGVLPVANGGIGAGSLADLIPLGTDTTGNYLATLSSSGSITVAGSGSETAAATVNLNLANSNAWTALQTFTAASSSIFSNTGTSYFGGTATTTIDSAGNLVVAGDATVVGTTTTANFVNNAVTANTLLYANGIKQQASASVTGPLTFTSGILAISNAAADGSTKGASTYTATDFNDNGSGLISLDYTNGQKASGSVPGFLSSADWTTFNTKLASSSLSSSAMLASLIGDETGTGALVFGTSPTFSGTVNLASGTANRFLMTDGSNNIIYSASSTVLANSITDETGTGSLVFAASPSFTGTANFVTTQNSGLLGVTGLATFSGGASTTQLSVFQKAYFGGTATSTFDIAGNLSVVSNGLTVGTNQLVVANGNVGIGTSTPWAKLTLWGANTTSGIQAFNVTNSASTTNFAIDNAGFISAGASLTGTPSGIFSIDASSSTTTISNLSIGNLVFDTDAGTVNLSDLPVDANAAQGVIQSQAINIGGLPLITAYGESDGSGSVQNTRVSIGTSTTPWARLSVAGAGTGTGQLAEFFNSASTTQFRLLDNGTAYFAGNVGIGTTTPQNTLDIASNTSGGVPARITNTNSAGYSELSFYTAGSLLAGSVGYGNASVTSTQLASSFYIGPRTSTGSLNLVTGTAATVQATLTSGGTFGLGTTSPFGKLAISLQNGETYTGNNAFIIASSTASATTTLFSISNTGAAAIGSSLAINGASIGVNALAVTGSLGISGDVLGGSSIRAGSAGQFYFQSRSVLTSPSDGVIALQNFAQTDFSRLQLGGTTASFPSIKRNAAGIDFRLADDSAFANIAAANITANGTFAATGLSTLTGGFVSQASSTIVGLLTATNASTTNLSASASLFLPSILNSYLATDANGKVISTTTISGGSISGVIGISNGGTATSTQVTNGVNFFDGTKITSGTALIFDGANLTANGNLNGANLGLPQNGLASWVSRGSLSWPADGSLLLRNSAGTGFSSLQFGGSTNSFPALARSGTSLSVSPADGSLSAASFGIGTSTPFGAFGINLNNGANYGGNNAFIIASSTAGATSTLFAINNVGQALHADGTTALPSVSFVNDPTTGFFSIGSGVVDFAGSGSARIRLRSSQLQLGSAVQLGWSSTATVGTIDTIFTRKAAATFQLGAVDAAAPVAQTLGVQSVIAGTTDTAGTNFTVTGSRGTGTGVGGSILFQVAPAATTGSTQNALATALVITGAGNVGIGTSSPTNRLEISGNTFLGGNLTATGTVLATGAITSSASVTGTTGLVTGGAAGIQFSGRTLLTSASDGVLELSNNANTDFSRLQLGGTTASFPSIKRNAAGIDFRLADDSAYANVAAANITANGTFNATGNTTLANATSTNFFSTSASSTNLYSTNGTIGVLSAGTLNLSGIGTFASGFVSQASSTVAGLLTATNASTTNLSAATSFFLPSITNSYLATDASGKVIATTTLNAASISGVISISNGGTATSTQVTNGINYFDGTRITSGSVLTFNGTNLGLGTSTPWARLTLWGANTTSGSQAFNVTNSASTTNFAIDNAGFISAGASLTGTPSGIFSIDASSSTTTISNLSIGNLVFDTDAGMVALSNIPLSANPAAGTINSQSILIGDTSVLTVYGENDGSTTGAQNTRVAIGTSTIPFARLSVAGAGTTTGQLAEFFNAASTTVFRLLDNGTAYFAGNLGIGTTSPTNKLEVSGNTFFGGNVTATGTLAVSGQTTLAGASSTALTVSGNTVLANATSTAFFSTTASSTNLSAQTASLGSLTLGSATTTAGNGINLTSGCFSVGGTCVGSGSGSGTVGSGTQGQFAFYNGAGTTLTATSSLFLSQSGNIGIGTTSPYAMLSVAGNIVGTNITATGTLAVAGNTTLANATSTNFFSTTASSTNIYSTNGNIGVLSAGTLNIVSTLGVSGLSTLTGGFVSQASSTVTGAFTATGAVALGSTLNVTGNTVLANATSTNFFSTTASSTNLFSTNANLGVLSAGTLSIVSTLNVSGLSTFANGFVSQASSTVVGNFTSTGTVSGSSFTGAGTGLTGTAASLTAGAATILATSRNINSTAFNGSADITITAASSTLLANNNTFSGVNAFTGNTVLANATSTAFFSTTASSTNLSAQTASLGSLTLGSATTTAGNGINLTSGCFSVGGTCIGGASGASLSVANTWTALQLFSAGASTTNLSVFGTAYFGGTATSSFNSLGQLSLAGLGVPAGSFLAVDPNGTIIATTSPTGGASLTGTTGQFPYFSGTNTAVGTSSIFLATSGAVGIGTTTPGAQLEIVKTLSGATADQLYVSNQASATSTATRFSFRAQDIFGRATTTAAISSIFQQNFNGGKGDLALFTLQSGSLSEVMRLTGAGFVGIGTSTPQRRLDVVDPNSVPQIRISNSILNYAEQFVDSVGTLFISTSGGNIKALNENLFVCSGGGCPTSTATSTEGNLFVENAVTIGDGFSVREIDSTQLGLYNVAGALMVTFDNGQ